MIKAIEQLNCITTNTFLDKEDFPACMEPFKTFTGLKEER